MERNGTVNLSNLQILNYRRIFWKFSSDPKKKNHHKKHPTILSWLLWRREIDLIIMRLAEKVCVTFEIHDICNIQLCFKCFLSIWF